MPILVVTVLHKKIAWEIKIIGMGGEWYLHNHSLVLNPRECK